MVTNKQLITISNIVSKLNCIDTKSKAFAIKSKEIAFDLKEIELLYKANKLSYIKASDFISKWNISIDMSYKSYLINKRNHM